MLSFSKMHVCRAALRTTTVTTTRKQQRQLLLPQQHGCVIRLAHTVRIIATADLPHGKAYEGDVLDVKAGYARNYLIPKKMAVYATRQNFERLGIKDPDRETLEEKRARLEREASADEDRDLKAADILRYYLRNKVLKIWRNVDPVTDSVTPGMVDAKAVRKKLSKQLLIELEPHEKVHLRAEPLLPSEAATEAEVEAMLQELGDAETDCTTEIRQLGNFLARISLRGGYSIPLRVKVLKR